MRLLGTEKMFQQNTLFFAALQTSGIVMQQSGTAGACLAVIAALEITSCDN